MSRPEAGTPVVWLRYARSDLALAALSPQPEMLLESLCFHAQQAAEKAIKAVLLAMTGAEPPHVHSLGYLLTLLPEGRRPPGAESIAQLTRYAVQARYPDDLSEVGEDEWQQAVAIARHVVVWAERVVSAETEDGRIGRV